ncbi:MAG: LacI family transcriptional regulator [Ruminococcaceae bacterium]|nr:LacI family transcriptional regulator [Oscillospiraceae bacterium]
MDKKITIKQIAQMAGVSVASVSYVVNGKKGVGEETQKKVMEIIEKTNYTPNVNSQRLILKKSFNLIVALDEKESPINNFFYAEIMNSIVESAAKLRYNIVLITVGDKYEGSRLNTTLLQHNADGIIFLGDIKPKFAEEISKTNTPYVIIDSQKTNPPYPCVRADYKQSSRIGVRHLVENGHKRIALIGSDKVPDYFEWIYEGYIDVLNEESIKIKKEWIQSNAFDAQGSEICIENILMCKERPTAVFCSSDIVAICVMNYLQKRGYSIPQDFSVCSIDDISMSKYHYPALTTIHIDKKAMGEIAVNMLDKLINGEDTDTDISVTSEILVKRNSVKAL